ncbi:MAG TPA: hypothetical protein VIV11_38525 [Kofleriaceae bacterium]
MLLLLAACGGDGQMMPVDARVLADAGDTRSDGSSQQPYRHAIALDGVDDFATGEQFATTSTSFAARVTWDDKNLYIGYDGPDLTPSTTDAATKWLFIYLDTTAGGQAQSELYNTQRATFPLGFAADYYVRYKCDGTFTTLERNDSGTWNTATPTPMTAQAGMLLELAIPLSSIGAGAQVGIVTWMINEQQLVEGSYAGLYANNFTDGYAADLALTAYLQADFTSPRAPNDPANRRP